MIRIQQIIYTSIVSDKLYQKKTIIKEFIFQMLIFNNTKLKSLNKYVQCDQEYDAHRTHGLNIWIWHELLALILLHHLAGKLSCCELIIWNAIACSLYFFIFLTWGSSPRNLTNISSFLGTSIFVSRRKKIYFTFISVYSTAFKKKKQGKKKCCAAFLLLWTYDGIFLPLLSLKSTL